MTIRSDPIYAVGTIGFDFGTEARRDSFAEDMRIDQIRDRSRSTGAAGDRPVPDDPLQVHRYLQDHRWALDKVIWTLKVDRDAVYALEPEPDARASWQARSNAPDGTVVHPVYSAFMKAIAGQAEDDQSEDHISQVSLAGSLTGRDVRLLSRAVVPVVEVMAKQVYLWFDNAIVESATSAFLNDERIAEIGPGVDTRGTANDVVQAILNKTHAELRNRGLTPADRALNFLGTGLVHLGEFLKEPLFAGWELSDVQFRRNAPAEDLNFYTLGRVIVSKSPVDRINSDCWDVNLVFFDPRAPDRAKACYIFTVDVSDRVPVLQPTFYSFLSSGRESVVTQRSLD